MLLFLQYSSILFCFFLALIFFFPVVETEIRFNKMSATNVVLCRHVKDSTAAACVTILFFILPSKLDFLRAFDSDPINRPTKPSPGMISWKMINQKMHWSLILVLGGGFAISAGSTSSNLSSIVGNALVALKLINPFAILIIVCVFAETVTELTSNVAVANIILPVLAEMVRSSKRRSIFFIFQFMFAFRLRS